MDHEGRPGTRKAAQAHSLRESRLEPTSAGFPREPVVADVGRVPDDGREPGLCRDVEEVANLDLPRVGDRREHLLRPTGTLRVQFVTAHWCASSEFEEPDGG